MFSLSNILIFIRTNYKIIGSFTIFVSYSISAFYFGYDYAASKKDLVISELKLKAKEIENQNVKLTLDLTVKTNLLNEQITLNRNLEKEKQKEVIKYVDREIVKYKERNIAKCDIPNDWVRIDSESAKNSFNMSDSKPFSGSYDSTSELSTSSKEKLAYDSSPSGFNEIDVLEVNIKRNEICHNEMSKLRSLQDYVSGIMKIVKEEN